MSKFRAIRTIASLTIDSWGAKRQFRFLETSEVEPDKLTSNVNAALETDAIRKKPQRLYVSCRPADADRSVEPLGLAKILAILSQPILHPRPEVTRHVVLVGKHQRVVQLGYGKRGGNVVEH